MMVYFFKWLIGVLSIATTIFILRFLPAETLTQEKVIFGILITIFSGWCYIGIIPARFIGLTKENSKNISISTFMMVILVQLFHPQWIKGDYLHWISPFFPVLLSVTLFAIIIKLFNFPKIFSATSNSFLFKIKIFYNKFLKDFFPHRVALFALRVAFTPSQVIKEISEGTENKLPSPIKFLTAITVFMLLLIGFLIGPESDRLWPRSIGKLSDENIIIFRKCFNIPDSINIRVEAIKSHLSIHAQNNVLSKKIYEKVGSLEYEKILVFTAIYNKDLALEMINEKKIATSFDQFTDEKTQSFIIFLTVIVFSTIIHFFARPHNYTFITSLQFGCYFCGTFYLWFVLSAVLLLWNSIFLILIPIIIIYSWVVFNRAIGQLYSKKYWKANAILIFALMFSEIYLIVMDYILLWIINKSQS